MALLHPRRTPLLVLTSLSLIVGCGSDPATATTGTTTGETTASGGAGGMSSTTGMGGNASVTGVGGAGGGIIDPGCASALICGNGQCCAVGEECVSAACLPACASEVRCGAGNAVCCAAGELCLSDVCVAAKGPCLDYADCDANEFCEPTLGKCVPEVPGAPICEFKPPAAALTPKIEWSWTDSAIHPEANQIINMPVVIDLDKDTIPDVVVVTSADFTSTHAGYLRALNGKDGTEKWLAGADVYQVANAVNPRGTPAAADIDGDGNVDIVTPKTGGGLIAFDHTGKLMWSTTKADGTTPYVATFNSATVSIADLDADGKPEIVAGGVVFDAGGKLLADNGPYAGSHDVSYGAVSIVADVDGDGKQELVTGNSAYDLKGTHVLWTNGLSDGYPAIANLDGDGKPEIVVVTNGSVRVQSAATGAMLATLKFPAGVAGAGGPPTIADFDGDGNPDFSTAGAKGYMVFKYAASPPAITLLWQSVTQDASSNRTGSSVFDFQGDGSAEVVYGDECYFRIYDGKTGATLFQDASTSATIHEYPVIADVDGDNNTEIVVVSNDTGGGACPQYTAAEKPRHGVFVYGDAADSWVRTRRVWNQHAYHLTNISADGSIPTPELVSWIGPQGLNNYRQSSQGAGVYNAPDLQVSLAADLGGCPGVVHLDALVQNHGSLGVAAGVKVSFYAGTSAAGMLIADAITKKALLPGQYEDVSVDYMVPVGAAKLSFYVAVDGVSPGMSSVSECLEDNNAASVDGVMCPMLQ
jgi:VCBS repeat protein